MKILKLITAGLLIFAIFPLPYGYYQFLRLFVAIASGISAFVAYEDKNQGLAIIFAIVLILFNPLIPIYLSKEIWIPIDIIVGIFFGVSGVNENS
mgnify:CR=1 FL=1